MSEEIKKNEKWGRIVIDDEGKKSIEYAPLTIGDVFRPGDEILRAEGYKLVNKDIPPVAEGMRRSSIDLSEDEQTIFHVAVDKPEVDETVWPEEPYRVISDTWEETEDSFVRHVVAKHIVDEMPDTPTEEGFHWEAVGEEETDDAIIIKYEQVQDPPVPPPPPTIYSKLYLEIALARRGLLDKFDAWLNSAEIPLDPEGSTMSAKRLYDRANELASDNALFSTVLASVQAALEVDDATRDAILAEGEARS